MRLITFEITFVSRFAAAHCFWNNKHRESVSATLYRVAVGKHTLGWTTRDGGEQRHGVKTIHMSAYFAGHSKRLESDIALVELSSPVTVSESVNVVCVHWKVTVDDGKLTNTSLGTVGLSGGQGSIALHTHAPI